MPAARGQKRKSEQMTASTSGSSMQQVATQPDDGLQESPSKRQRTGLTMENKQKLIDNLRVELADRARKLRAQYHLHTTHLRFRIETRAKKIPASLRKMKMGDLLAKRIAEEQRKTAAPPASTAKPPPVPPKDVVVGRPALPYTAQGSAPIASPVRVAKRPSEDISGGDKENEMAHIDYPKKKARANPAGAATRPPPNPSQVLSPTSSNSRVLPPRERPAAPSPARSFIARPVSPVKPATSSSGMFSSMVEKARSTTRAAATTRKTTTSSMAISAAAPAPPAATRTRKAAAAPAPRAGASSRTTRRVSAISESSDGSTGTVVRKRTTTAAAPAPPAKRTVMGTIRKGVTGTATKKAPAAKAAPAAAGTGRVLRKRNN